MKFTQGLSFYKVFYLKTQNLCLDISTDGEKKFNDFENWCDKNKILKVNACINTILNDKLFNKIIISVSNMSQLNQILDSFKNKRLKKIPNRFQTCDKKLIDPRLWKIN